MLDHDDGAAVELYWIPLGAGGWFVKFNGVLFEAIKARIEHRARCRLLHAALIVRLGDDVYGLEQTPAWGRGRREREVVATGAVGVRRAGWTKLLRYEVHISPGGGIPDIGEAVDVPRRLSEDERIAATVLGVAHEVPAPTWGRDELHAGEMWNSNSVIAWTLLRAGIDASAIQPPTGCRAPGWDAGLMVAGAQV